MSNSTFTPDETNLLPTAFSKRFASILWRIISLRQILMIACMLLVGHISWSQGILSGGGTAPGTIYPGQNALLYSFKVEYTGATGGTTLNHIIFSTTGTVTSSDITSYSVYLSTSATIATAPIYFGGADFSAAAATYTVGPPNYWPVPQNDETFYVLIVANLAPTATLGHTVAVSLEPGGDVVWENADANTGSGAAGGTATIGSYSCTSTVYGYTDAIQTYTVPTGCTQLVVTAVGGQGGANGYFETYLSGGGLGGLVTATVNVTSSSTLDVYVGGQGGMDYSGTAADEPGGFNGGGASGYLEGGVDGGGGGGASDVSTSTTLNASTILVAAGGGGGAGMTATNYVLNYSMGGAGGSAAAGGTAGNGYYNNAAVANTAGTATGGGTGGYAPGTANTGGNGRVGAHDAEGGGGGGFYGGSSGSAIAGGSGSGGGGGSSFVQGTASTSATYTSGINTGNGYVVVTPVPPTAYVVSGSGTGCSATGLTITLSGSQDSVNYQLYNGSATVGSPTTGTGSSLTWTTTVSGTYSVAAYYTGYSGCTTSMSSTAIITINPTPAMTGGSSSICVYTTTTLTATPASGTWTSTNTAIATIDPSLGIVTAGSTAGTTTISYTINGCSVAQTETITDNTPMEINGPGVSFCGGSSIGLSDATTGGEWTSLNTAVATATTGGTTSTITGVAPGGTATIQYSTGCGLPVTYVVTVNTTPTAILGTHSLCFGGTTSLSDVVSSGDTWSSSLAGIASVVGSGATATVTGVAAGTAIITCTASDGCYATTTVTVNLPPVGITGPDVVSTGGTVTLTDGSTGGTWTTSNADATVGSATGLVTGVTAGTVNITYANTCGSAIMNVTVEALCFTEGSGDGAGCPFYELSSFSISGGACGTDLNDPDIPCPTSSGYVDHTSLSPVKMFPGGTYAGTISDYGYYTPDDAYVWIDFNNDGTFAASEQVWFSNNICCTPAAVSIVIPALGVDGVSYGTHRMRVRNNHNATLASGCAAGTDGSAVDYLVEIVPSVSVTSSSPVCYPGGTLTLTATPAITSGGSTYSWSGPDGYSALTTNNNIATTSVSLVSGTYSVSLNVAGVSSCPGTATTIVTVNTAPTLTSASNSGPVCSGNTLSLNANGESGVTGYLWTGPVAITSSTSSIATVPGATASAAGIYTVTVTDGTGSGCTAAYTTSVTVVTSANPISGNLSVCTSAITSLSDPGGGTWSSSSANISIPVSTVGNVTGVNAGTTATITYTLLGGCFTTAVVTVIAAPAAISGNVPVCVGTTIPLSDLSGLGSWSSSNPGDGSINSSTGAFTGLYGTSNPIITYTNTATGCTMTAITTVDALPGAILGSLSVCMGSSITLTETASGTWSSTSGNVSVTSGTGAVQGVSAGTAVITFTVPGGCTATAIVTVNPGPTLISGPSTVAISTVNSFSDGVGGGTWAVSGDATITGTSSLATLTADGVIGTATITYTESGCSTTLVVTVSTVTVGPITGASTACANASFTMTDATAGGTWSASGDAIVVGAGTTGTVTAGATAGTAIISYTISGVSSTSIITINVAPTAVTAGAAPNPICNGGTLALNGAASGATSYSWTGPAGTGITSSGSINASVNGVVAGNAGVYTLAATNACGTTYASTNAVTVNQLPTTLTATVNPNPVCQGNSVAFTATSAGGSGVTYAWTGGTSTINNATAINGTANITATSLTDATAYTVTASAPGCATSTAVTSVLAVNKLPTTFTATVNPNPVCQGNPITLTATSTGGTGVTYAWTGGTSTINNPTAINGTASITATALTDATAYTVTASAPGCTTSTAITSALTVNKLPITFTATVNPNPVCQGSSVTLTATSAGGSGVTYAWTGGTSTINNPTAINGTASITTTALTDATAYTVTASAPGCTTSTAFTSALAVNKLPTTLTATVNPNPVCQSSSITLAATSAGGSGVTYAWTGGTSIINNPTAINGTASITATASTDATAYTVTASATGCGSTTASTSVLTVTPTAPSGLTAGATPNPICNGGTLALNGAATGATSYAWTGPGGTPIASPTSLSTSVNGVVAANAGVYTLAATNACGTTTAQTSTVVLAGSLPTGLTASATPNPICNGGTLALNGAASGAISYSWAGPGGTSITSSASINATVNGVVTGNAGVYTLSATNVCGTVTALTNTVSVDQLPAAFTATVTPGSVCKGNSITLTTNASGGSGVTYAWTGGTSTINNPTAINGTASITATALTDATAYTLTATAPGCGTSTAVTSVLIVNGLPTTFTATVNPNPVCQGNSITLTATSTGGSGVTYAWTGGTSVINNPTAINGAASITATALTDATAYTVTASAPGCSTTTAVTSVLAVNKLPTTLTATVNPNPVCQGSSINLTATSAGGTGVTYAWTGGTSVINNPTAINGTAGITATALTDATAYTVTAAAAGCAGNMQAATNALTVNKLPTTFTATVNPNPVCLGNSISLTATSTGGSGVTYAWTGGTSTINNPTAINGTASITATAITDATAYTVTASAPACATSTAVTGILTVNKLPTTLTATVNPNPVCQGSSINLTATSAGGSGITYAWTGGTSIINNPTAINGTASITATALTDATAYTVTASAPGCIATTAVTSALTVNAMPTITASVNPNPVCQGSSVTLTATSTGGGGVTYAWTGGTSTINNPTAINGTASITATALTDATAYTLTATAPGCATQTAVTSVLAVNILPTTFTATVNPNPVCQGSSITLTATSTGGSGVTYAWTGGTSTINNPTAINGTASITATALTDATAYTVTASAPGCGTSTAATSALTVNKLPTTFTATVNPNPVCQGNSITLTATATGGSGVTYAWTGGTSVINNPTAINGTASITATALTDATAYTVTASAPGCATLTAVTGALAVNKQPTTFTATVNPNPVCQGSSITLAATSAGGSGVTYAWTGGTSTINNSTTINGTASITATALTDATAYTVTASAPGCAPSTAVTSVLTVNELPAITATVNPNPVCQGNSITLTATSTGGSGVTYAWTGGTSTINNPTAINGTASITATALTDATAYTITASAPGCNTTTAVTGVLVVNKLPTTFTATVNPNPVCQGNSITFAATSVGGSGVTYAWTGGTSVINNPTAINGTASITATALTDATAYTVIASAPGCATSTAVTSALAVNKLPTTFTATVNPNPVCQGNSITLTATSTGGSGVTYAWTGGTSVINNPTFINGAAGISSTALTDATAYTVTASAAGCATYTAVTSVLAVNELPITFTATVNPNPVCQGNSITLTATSAGGSGVTYAWTGGTSTINNPTAINGTAGITATALTDATAYTVTASAAGCVGDVQAETGVLAVNKLPTSFTATVNPNPVCQGSSITLAATSTGGMGVTYAWTGGTSVINNPTAINGTASITATAATDATAYTVTASATGCAGNVQAATTALVVTPTIPTGLTASAAPNPICNGGTLALNGSAVDAASYSWSGPGGAAITSPTSATTSVNGVMAGNAGVYTLAATNVCGTATMSTGIVTINTVPTGVTASANSVLCVTGTLTLTGTATGATGYSWSGPGGIPITSSTSLDASVNGVVAGNAGVYTLAATNTCGTTTNTTPSVTVNATPTASADNSGFICGGGTVTLTSSIIGGSVVNYLWNGADILTGAGSSSATAAPTVVGANTYTLSVNDGTGNSGCASQSITTVTVNATPAANPTNTGYICNGGTVTIVANPSNGASVFTWSGLDILSGAGTATITATPTDTSVYSVMVSDGSGHSGCSPLTQFTTTVNVSPTPGISSIYNTGYICNGGTVSLVAIPSTFLYPTAYTWTGPGLLSSTGENPMATPTVNSTYTVTVSDGSSQSGCSPSTQYTTTVDVHITPSAAPSSNSPICIGGTVSLVANETYNVIDYTWTGSNLSSSTIADPTATPTSSTVYTLVVSDGSGQSGCSPVTQYTTAVTVNGVPSVSVTNNGPVCADMQLTLTASAPANVTGYSWAGPVSITNNTSAIASVPDAQTNATGTYTVTVNNGVGSGCTASFTTQATVNALPTQYNVTGGGPYCAGSGGDHIGLSGSDTGITYNLNNGSSPFGALPGTGYPLDYYPMTVAGTYTVLAVNNSTGCNNNMNDSAVVIVNPLPNIDTVLSSSPSYCYGHTGVDVSLSGSELGIKYQLYLGSLPIGAAVNGNTDSISFGIQTIAGDYFVIATDTTTGCTNYMYGAAEIIVDSLPTVYNVSSGGAYCAGGTGIDITLNGSQTGVTYRLMNSTLGIVPMSGTGTILNYGSETDTGTYTIVATNNSTSCSSVMNGNPVIVMNPLPAIDTVTGSGTYCQGTSGDSVDLNGSSVGINYRLFNGAALVDTVMGTGAAFSFGPQTAGVYTVTAFNATTGCTSGMYGTAAVTMNPAPTTYGITGIANYCANAAGVNIILSGSNTGITYTLYKGPFPDSAMAGTGSPLNFGTYTAGDYLIIASNNATSCTSTMSGGGTVGVNAQPVAYDVTGGGPYCAGGAGPLVGVSSSDAGVKYYLYAGSSLVDSMLSGTTGTPVSFGPQATVGTYTVNAVNVSTSCTNNMSDSAVVTEITPVTPSVTVTTGMGDTVCLGNTITFTANPVNGGSTPMYKWYLNASEIADATNIYTHIPANGDVIEAVLISSAACATPDTVSASDTMTVETQATPSVSITVNPGTLVCAGTSVTFTAASAYGGSSPAYSWMVNGVVSGAGSAYTYMPANGDNVSVELTSNFTCAVVDTAVANVAMSVGTASIPVVEIVASPGTSIPFGTTDTLTASVTNAGSSVAYQWVVNSTVITGATNAVYYSSTFNNNDSVTCQVINNNGCNLEGFNSVTITVFPLDIKAVTFGSGDIRLIPNPNQGNFSIKGTLGTTVDQEVTMEVTDILGQVIYNNKVMVHNGLIDQSVQLSSTLANGMYIMNLRSGTDSKVIHFVIEQ